MGHPDQPHPAPPEAFSPWSVVNLVFEHLADRGLHPTLGDGGDPASAAAALLQSLGITPAAEGDPMASVNIQDKLSQLRSAMFDDS